MSKQKTAPTNDTIVVSHNKFVLFIVVTLIVGLAAGAFVLSFDALLALALASAINESIAWIWPLIIDGFIVTATIAVFSLRGRGGKSTWYPWAALALFAFVSVFGNSLHAVNNQDILGVDVWIASCVSAAPAVALLIASHFLVIMISAPKHIVEQQVEITDTSGLSLGKAVISQPFTEPHVEHKQTSANDHISSDNEINKTPSSEVLVETSDDVDLSKKNFKSEPVTKINVPEDANFSLKSDIKQVVVEPVPEPVELILPNREDRTVNIVGTESKPVEAPTIIPATFSEPVSEVNTVVVSPSSDVEEKTLKTSSSAQPVIEEKTAKENVKPEKLKPVETVTSINDTVTVDKIEPVRKKAAPRKTVPKKVNDNVLVVNEKTSTPVVEEKPELTQTLLMKRILSTNNSESVQELAAYYDVSETIMGKRVKTLQDKHGQNFENHPSKRK